ncbi:MAG: hypothetical protein GY801_42250 [bacterium]|nr:hypothetical protein [bacterium]
MLKVREFGISMFSQHPDLSGCFGKTASRCEPLQRFSTGQETAEAVHEWERERLWTPR